MCWNYVLNYAGFNSLLTLPNNTVPRGSRISCWFWHCMIVTWACDWVCAVPLECSQKTKATTNSKQNVAYSEAFFEACHTCKCIGKGKGKYKMQTRLAPVSILCCHSSPLPIYVIVSKRNCSCMPQNNIFSMDGKCWPRAPKTKIMITRALWQTFCTGTWVELQFPASLIITVNFISFLVAPLATSCTERLILLKTFGCVCFWLWVGPCSTRWNFRCHQLFVLMLRNSFSQTPPFFFVGQVFRSVPH